MADFQNPRTSHGAERIGHPETGVLNHHKIGYYMTICLWVCPDMYLESLEGPEYAFCCEEIGVKNGILGTQLVQSVDKVTSLYPLVTQAQLCLLSGKLT